MHVEDIMTSVVHTCARYGSLSDAARLMWEHDVGALPVVDQEGRPIAMITDRDICMATYTQNRSPWDIQVNTAMSDHVHTCHRRDLVSTAERTMRVHQVRRLPVVDDNAWVVGILSLNDIALARTRTPLSGVSERLRGDVARTLAAISQHRSHDHHASSRAENRAGAERASALGTLETL